MVVSIDRVTAQTNLAEGSQTPFSVNDHIALLRGDILVTPQTHPHEPASVRAQMYVPLSRPHIWPQVTNYRRWTQFFPNITHSEVIETVKTASHRYRRLYQVGCKGFMVLTAEVEVYLRVFETACDRIQFRLEQGTFSHFAADLNLQDMNEGTLLTYAVQAAPTIPVPTFLIEQAMKTDLPGNMRQMRQVLCSGHGVA